MARLILTLALLLAGCATGPAVISPLQWGGEPSAPPAEAQRIQHITVHHQGLHWPPDGDVQAYLRRLQQWSRLSKRWSDIPYHYVIAPDGRIYAARPEGLPGDTNTGYDPRGHALLMLMGNFDEQQPSAQQLDAAVALMVDLARRHGLSATAIASHRDHSPDTACPGANLWPLLPTLRERVAAALAA